MAVEEKLATKHDIFAVFVFVNIGGQVSVNFVANEKSLLLPSYQLWAGCRIVLVTIGFLGVTLFVFVNIGGQVLPVWQLEIVCGG